MDDSYFNITFVAKLTFYFQNTKFIMAENQKVDVRVSYQNLPKKDKGKFLRYLSKKYDYPASTMSGKLRENPISSLRRDEELNIIQTINEGLWDQ